MGVDKIIKRRDDRKKEKNFPILSKFNSTYQNLDFFIFNTLFIYLTFIYYDEYNNKSI